MTIPASLTAQALACTASRAGALIMDIYARDDRGVETKSDGSSVTEADKRAEELILADLKVLCPGLPVIAEESMAAGVMPAHGESFVLVDPLDGTKEFINKNGEFTVNIAVIHQGRPAMGVVYVPAKSRIFVAESPSRAWQAMLAPGAAPSPTGQVLSIRKCPATGPVAVASRSHRSAETDEVLSQYGVQDTVSAGSSLKFCLVAAGEADMYPRLGRTMEWDTGAGQAVAEAAGARVIDHETGKPLLYGKRERGYDNPNFIVLGDITPV